MLGRSSRVRRLLVILATAVAATALPTGCFVAPSRPPLGPEPEAIQPPGDAPYTPYHAWTNHTDGKVGEDLFPILLPDGSGVLFASNRHSPRYKIYLRRLGEHTVRQITHGEGDDAHCTVAADGDRMVFASNRSGRWALYLMDGLDDPEVRRLTEETVDSVHPSFSPNGKEVAFNRRSPVSGEWEIWILDLTTGQPRFVCNGLFPSFHPMGHLLAFQRHRRRDEQWYSIWTIETDGTREREIVSGKDWAAVNPEWSPSGAQIVFNTVRSLSAPTEPNRGDDIFVVGANGEQPTRLTFSAGAEWNPFWGTDGRIYFNATIDGATAVWSLAPE